MSWTVITMITCQHWLVKTYMCVVSVYHHLYWIIFLLISFSSSFTDTRKSRFCFLHVREESRRQPTTTPLDTIERSLLSVKKAAKQFTLPITHELHLQTIWTMNITHIYMIWHHTWTPHHWMDTLCGHHTTEMDTLCGHHTTEWHPMWTLHHQMDTLIWTSHHWIDTICRHLVHTAQAQKHNIYGHHIRKWMKETCTPYTRKLHRLYGACKPNKESVTHVVRQSQVQKAHYVMILYDRQGITLCTHNHQYITINHTNLETTRKAF